VGGLSSIVIKQLLLPIQIQQLAPSLVQTMFTLVSVSGPLVALVLTPIIGALSDRTTGKHGRRRPYIAAGALVAVIGMSIMATASNIPVLMVGEVGAQTGIDVILAMVTAVIPDQIGPSQRSLFSSLAGMAPNLGGALGVLLVTRLPNVAVVWQGYLLMATASLLGILFFLSVFSDPPLERASAFSWGLVVRNLLSPLRSRNFVLVFVSRCLVYYAFVTVSSYLLFSLLHTSLRSATNQLALFQDLSTAILVLAALLTGWLAKWWPHPKKWVMIGAGVMALGLLVLAFVSGWLVMAAAFFGLGFGIYLGRDIQLAVQVLTSTHDHGRDLAIMYDGIYLPLILSPLIGGLILNITHSFVLIWVVAALASLAAAGVLVPINVQEVRMEKQS
jgi:MFS family permease